MRGLSERRTHWLFAALLSLQLVFLSLQVPDPSGRGSRLEGALLRLVAPIPRLVSGAGATLDALAVRLATRRQLQTENDLLRGEVEALRRERVSRFGLEADLERLTSALAYEPPPRGALIAADIVYIDHSSWLKTLVLYTGAAPVERDQPVISADGLVGRVILASGPYAKVQLITDRAASVGAMVERTRRQGVVRGADGGRLELDFVPLQADVKVGDRVLSAGIDGIYNRGIPLGVVARVEPGDELFHRIELDPVVDFGLLDQVFVLQREPLPESLKRAPGDARP